MLSSNEIILSHTSEKSKLFRYGIVKSSFNLGVSQSDENLIIEKILIAALNKKCVFSNTHLLVKFFYNEMDSGIKNAISKRGEQKPVNKSIIYWNNQYLLSKKILGRKKSLITV